MRQLRNIITTVLAGLGAMAMAGAAAGQVPNQTHCGISSPNAIVATVYYDPFQASSVSSTSVTITVNRFVGSKQDQKTQQVDFYLVPHTFNPIPSGMQMQWNGNNVLYQNDGSGLGVGAPTLSLSNSCPTGTVCFNFGANTDTASFTLVVTLPNAVDVSQGDLTLDIAYACNGTGDHFDNVGPVPPGTISGAMTLPIYVVNALQANWAGSAAQLDFGDITNVPNAGPFPTPVSGNINVASSGPYEVTVTSNNTANPFTMTAGESHTGTAIPYSLSFLGQSVIDGTHPFPMHGCTRAGIPAKQLPISATLESGGAGKPFGDYKDTINVTFTPLNATPSPAPC